MKTLLNANDAQDLLTPEAIKENCGFELDELGTVKIYLDELAQRNIDVIGWTADELYEDFKLWYEDDYADDDPELEALLDGSREWPEEGEDFDPTTEDMIDEWDEDFDNGVDNTVL